MSICNIGSLCAKVCSPQPGYGVIEGVRYPVAGTHASSRIELVMAAQAMTEGGGQ
jgi:hypothetical protein